MPQAHAKAVWCLARANEPPCVLSTRELLILAQLGRLRADDLLWRSGSNAKQSIRAMLGARKPSPARPPLAAMRLPPAVAPMPAPTQKDIEASVIAPASGAEERGQGRNWALAGAITGMAIVVSLAGAGAAIFLQSQPAEPETSIATPMEGPTVEPAATSDPPPPVTTDEVAVRKVKVLEITAPPPGH